MTGNVSEQLCHLLVIDERDGQRTISLDATTYSIGRDARNSIVLNFPSVSRQHAVLLRLPVLDNEQYRFQVIDGDFKGKRSTNGLYVNGNKCSSHKLVHGDVIRFGSTVQARYYAVSESSNSEIKENFNAEQVKGIVSQDRSFDTLIGDQDNLEGSSEAALARLASFPELNPNPIIEVDTAGNLTYINPEALLKFPDIRSVGKKHPVFEGLFATEQFKNSNYLVREIEIQGEIFEQSIHYIPESELIRVFLTDITQRKQNEAELQKRDRLLAAVTQATTTLLLEIDGESAIRRAFATIAQAAELDRVCLFENHPHLETAEMAMSLRIEWSSPSLPALLSTAQWQNQSYRALGLQRWYEIFNQGEVLSSISSQLPDIEKIRLTPYQIQSLLIVPIHVDQQLWGYLSFQDCQKERQWSNPEESILRMMGVSISAALKRQQTEDLIRYHALHDMLTDLPNRMLFDERLKLALRKASSQSKNLAVMFLDLDRFKTINDSLGHTVGDELLKIVAQRLKKAVNPEDTVARWGGDEFTIILPQVDSKEDVTVIASKILETLSNVFFLEGHELYISVSIGIALFNESCSDAETLVQYADAALYYAKEQGKNNYQFYTSFMSVKVPALLTLEKSLRHALEQEELMVYYQPRINVLSGEITGMEALLRWHHPEMGLVAPNVFIPIAEENGLILPIGEWVLRTACQQNKLWQEAGLPPIVVAVNLSPRQFRQPQLIKTVVRILEETGLDPQYLELEITESMAIENIELTQSVLQKLRQAGIRLSIDDFGTGHSSLSRLQLLPLHSLKIDQSFVKELLENENVSHIVTAIVMLGQSLGLNIIAEGVENKEQLNFLNSIQCEVVQGFYFYRPIPAIQATEILSNKMTTLTPTSRQNENTRYEKT